MHIANLQTICIVLYYTCNKDTLSVNGTVSIYYNTVERGLQMFVYENVSIRKFEIIFSNVGSDKEVVDRMLKQDYEFIYEFAKKFLADEGIKRYREFSYRPVFGKDTFKLIIEAETRSYM